MRKKTILFCIILILSLFFIAGCTQSENKLINQNQAITDKDTNTKTSKGEVTIDLTPVKYENGIFTVEYGLNTHSADMGGIDLQKQVVLIFNDKKYSPINKPELSGHHNSGELQFQITEKPGIFKIIIVNVPDVKERILVWP